VVLLLLLAGWVGVDTLVPHKSKMREFDPNEVARLETAMWRSYYAHQRLSLFCQLDETLRTQYHMPFWKSEWTAFQMAKAAFIFKNGKKPADYEKALPNLRKSYAAVRAMSDIDFDIEHAARLELEWWIIHRERKSQPSQTLENALAELQAELYHVSPASVAEHARLRAAAMHIRDTKAVSGSVMDDDWVQIDKLLRDSWQSLYQAVNNNDASVRN